MNDRNGLLGPFTEIRTKIDFCDDNRQKYHLKIKMNYSLLHVPLLR